MRARLLALCALLVPATALGQKVYLNPSDQSTNPIAGGGNEAHYALINANLANTKINGFGFSSRVDQDFTNAPANANSWGANIFISIHSNAGGGHGTETLYKTTGGMNLADHIQKGELGQMPYQSRGLKLRNDLHVLNATNMYACLVETVFHDCAAASGYTGHPPSESSFLKSAAGEDKIATGIALGVCGYYNKTCQTQPATGTVMGVVYKKPTLTDHIAGATVKVNTGATKVYDGTNAWSFDLPVGSYTFTATAAGYQSGSSTATVVAGQTAWASIGLDPVAPANGTIQGFVYEDPDPAHKIAGASVTLSTGASATYDGAQDFTFDVPAGSYTLTASAAGYAQGQASVTVTAAAIATVQIALTRLVGADAGLEGPDAEAPSSADGSEGTADASGPQPSGDASAAWADASQPGASDASVPHDSVIEARCGCASGSAGMSMMALPIALLLLASRRRVRSTSRA